MTDPAEPPAAELAAPDPAATVRGLMPGVAAGATARATPEELAGVLAQLAAPWAEADKAKAIEGTKQVVEETRRVEIAAGVQKFNGVLALAFAVAVLVLATIALYKGKDALTEKIVIAVVGFVGGYGFGKAQKPAEKP